MSFALDLVFRTRIQSKRWFDTLWHDDYEYIDNTMLVLALQVAHTRHRNSARKGCEFWLAK